MIPPYTPLHSTLEQPYNVYYCAQYPHLSPIQEQFTAGPLIVIAHQNEQHAIPKMTPGQPHDLTDHVGLYDQGPPNAIPRPRFFDIIRNGQQALAAHLGEV